MSCPYFVMYSWCEPDVVMASAGDVPVVIAHSLILIADTFKIKRACCNYNIEELLLKQAAGNSLLEGDNTRLD
jgi:hypothetical protein